MLDSGVWEKAGRVLYATEQPHAPRDDHHDRLQEQGDSRGERHHESTPCRDGRVQVSAERRRSEIATHQLSTIAVAARANIGAEGRHRSYSGLGSPGNLWVGRVADIATPLLAGRTGHGTRLRTFSASRSATDIAASRIVGRIGRGIQHRALYSAPRPSSRLAAPLQAVTAAAFIIALYSAPRPWSSRRGIAARRRYRPRHAPTHMYSAPRRPAVDITASTPHVDRFGRGHPYCRHRHFVAR